MILTDDMKWVAEHVLGQKRFHCESSTISCSCHGMYESECECWFNCQWCGQHVEAGKAQPCPNYPFEPFTLEDVLKALPEPIIVWVRNDPWRDARKCTLLHDNVRITDTDDPLGALCKWLRENEVGL